MRQISPVYSNILTVEISLSLACFILYYFTFIWSLHFPHYSFFFSCFVVLYAVFRAAVSQPGHTKLIWCVLSTQIVMCARTVQSSAFCLFSSALSLFDLFISTELSCAFTPLFLCLCRLHKCACVFM